MPTNTSATAGENQPVQQSVIVGIALLLVIVIWSMKRHRSPKLKIESGASIEDLMPSLAGLSLGTAVAGNSVEVLENGAFFEVLLERIAAAQKSVHFETYLWKEGVLGQRMVNALSERARAGLKVRVLLDANGSKDVGEAARRQMEGAGCGTSSKTTGFICSVRCFEWTKAERPKGRLPDAEEDKIYAESAEQKQIFLYSLLRFLRDLCALCAR